MSVESNNLLKIYLTDEPANAPRSQCIHHVKQYIIPALMWRSQIALYSSGYDSRPLLKLAAYNAVYYSLGTHNYQNN